MSLVVERSGSYGGSDGFEQYERMFAAASALGAHALEDVTPVEPVVRVPESELQTSGRSDEFDMVSGWFRARM